jgi:hypothetical protein
VFSFQSNCVTKLVLIVVYKIVKILDIHCVSSNGYIESFDLNWIFVVCRNRVGFIEFFNKIL